MARQYVMQDRVHGALGAPNIDDPSDMVPTAFLQFLDPETLLRIPFGDPEAQGDQSINTPANVGACE